MASYLTLATFKTLTVMPSSDVDGIEAVEPGWIDAQLEYWSHWIDSRLAKRYVTPFAADPAPLAVRGWLARIVTPRAYLRRGVDPTDLNFDAVKLDAEKVEVEIKEAADAVTGLFDLPLIDNGSTGISKGTPKAYTEASPYVFTDVQARDAASEDANGEGTTS